MRCLTAMMAVGCVVCAGCASTEPMLAENPVFVPGDAETVWNTTVDVVNDYFVIERESRVDGRITTMPQIGATVLEPWRGDAANSQERWEGTLQSIRRRAFVQVTPADGGYFVGVEVFKELEDLPRPQFADAGPANFRHDFSPKRYAEVVTPTAAPKGWIAVGRDMALENRILCRLQGTAGAPTGY